MGSPFDRIARTPKRSELATMSPFAGRKQATARRKLAFQMLEDRELLTVFGADGRNLLQDVSDAPQRAVGRIEVTFPNGSSGHGSGVMISPFHMLTAAHVVFDKNRGGLATSVEVALGQTGPDNDDKPYGELEVARSDVLTYENWRENRDFRYDLAILRMPGNIGNYTGWFGFGPHSDAFFDSVRLNHLGYPGDKSSLDESGMRVSGTDMYGQFATFHDDRTDANGISPDYLWTTAFDTYGGHSGGPLYRYNETDGRIIVGIDSGSNSTTNVFVRINSNHGSAIQTVIENDRTGQPGDGRGIVGSGGSNGTPTDRAELLDYDAWLNTSFASFSPGTLTPGDTIQTRAVVQNNGTADAGSFRVAFYASTNATISTSDYLIGSTTISSLDAFDWADARFSGALPAIPSGQYYVGWIIDAEDSQTEWDESNNTGVITSQRLTVLAAGQAPVANDDSYEVEENEALHVTFSFAGVLGNDFDPDFDSLLATRLSDPSHGQLTFYSNGTFSYLPVSGFVGTDSFTYRAHDGTNWSNPATVTIQVHAAAQTLTANDDYYVTQENEALVISTYLAGVLGNDSEPESGLLYATLFSGPSHGQLSLGANGTFTYVPDPGFAGQDSFTYYNHDGIQGSNVAVATIEIHDGNDPPVAVDDAYRLTKDVILDIDFSAGLLANDSDFHGGQPGENNLPLQVVLVASPVHGTLTLAADGSFFYEPAAGFIGADHFTYRAVDALGNASEPATVSLSVQSNRLLAIGADAGGEPRVRVFQSGTSEMRSEFLAYAVGFTGGVRVAAGDMNGDGVAEIVTGPGPSGGPHIRVFDGATGEPAVWSPGGFFAYDAGFTGGVFVAAGDLDGDGIADIVTSPDAGGGPHIRIFSGADHSLLGEFLAYGIGFTGGVRVAVADVDGNGQLDIITAAGAGGGPHIRVFDSVHGHQMDGPIGSFFAFSPAFSGGVYVAAGDLDGDGFADIVTGAGAGGGPHVRAFSGLDGSELASFFAYDSRFAGGVRVGATSTDGNLSNIVLGAGPGGGPHVRTVDLRGQETSGFFAYGGNFTGGVFVAGDSSPQTMNQSSLDAFEARNASIAAASRVGLLASEAERSSAAPMAPQRVDRALAADVAIDEQALRRADWPDWLEPAWDLENDLRWDIAEIDAFMAVGLV